MHQILFKKSIFGAILNWGDVSDALWQWDNLLMGRFGNGANKFLNWGERVNDLGRNGKIGRKVGAIWFGAT